MSSLDAARQMLPWWAVWGPVLFTLPAALLLSFALTWLALVWPLWAYLRSAGQHWTERARWSYPLGQVMQVAPALLAVASGVAGYYLFSPLVPVPLGLMVGLVAGLALAGSSLACHLVALNLYPGRVHFADWPKGLLAFALARGWAIAFALAIVSLMPREFGPGVWGLLGLAAAGALLFGTGVALWALRPVGLIYPAPPRLSEAVPRVASRMGQPSPTALVIDSAGANAFAFLFLGWLVFTREIEDTLNDEELEALVGHEMAHLNEPLLAKLGRLVTSAAFVPLLAAGPVVSSFGWVGLAPLLVFPFFVLWLSGFLSRHLERVADEAGKGQEGSEGAYARALEKLHEVNESPVVMPGRGGTHPHLYDRMVAAGAQPEYERPRPPSRWRAVVPLSLMLMLLVAVGALPLVIAPAEGPGRGMAAYGPGEAQLTRLATKAWDEQDYERAVVWHRAAGCCAPDQVIHPTNEAIVLCRLGRCDEAELALAEAVRRREANHGRPGDVNLVNSARQAIKWCRTHGRQTR